MEQCCVIEPVSQERWQEAQAAESTVAVYSYENSRQSTQHIFDYLGIAEDRGGQTIVEVGCGPYPATSFCVNVNAVLFEPLWFAELRRLPNSRWLRMPFEDSGVQGTADEVWLFNCLQHVIDPEAIVEKSKRVAPTVRFFEPVDYPTCVYHPHTFTQADFERWFGNVQRYTDRLPGFFDADCCYGTWRNA